jgi:dihydrofolate reductase
MRHVVAGLFITVDNVTESPDKWQEHFDEDMLAAMQTHIDETDTILLGRVTYQEWFPYWPTASDEPFASHINNTPKYVVSTTLNRVEWGDKTNISLIKGDVHGAIQRLKQQPGKNIGVEGSPTLVRSLLEHDLLDQLTLLIHPVIAGRGRRLFKDDSALKRLSLISTKPTRTGTVILTYQLRM